MAESLRVLVAGWPNSPHVTAWAKAVEAAGHDVHIAGRDAPELPPSGESPNVHVLHGGGTPLVRSLRLSRDLARVAADLSPDLVHAHWLPEFGWMAAREGLRPLICSAWGSDVLRVRGFGRRRARRALLGAQLVLADSEHLARATRELVDVPVEVVRWGLDLEVFSPGDKAAARRALGLDHEGPLIASVRGLEPLYNPELLLEAFASVLERRPEARLLLKIPVKSVPPKVQAALDRLRLREAVMMLASVPAERMPDVYRAADAVVSIPSSDSSPRSVWEALACGVPVVVSDLPWAREELEHGRHALLAPLKAEAVAEAIERALDDDRLGSEGRALAQAELDPAACTRRIDALYRSVVEGR
jgi:glycosyltransferase involved in cell wall biosynthesis